MSFVMAYYLATFAVILITHETIFPVKGQCTVQGCDNGDPLISIVAEIQQLRVDLFDQLNKQVQNIHELLNASLQDTVMRNLQAADQRRSQEHDIYIKQGQSIHELLNATLQEKKSQHDTVNMSFQEVDRCPQEHDICSKQFQSIHNILNESFQVMKSHLETVETSLQAVDRRSEEQDIYIRQVQSIHELLNESFQQLKSQHDTLNLSLQAVDRRLQGHDISIMNQTQNSWKLANDSFDPASEVRDCFDIKASGRTTSGVYEVCVGHQLNRSCTSAFCDMVTANGSSLVFQRRKDGSVNFNRTWADYKQGFGNPNGEIWLGNEMLYLLTSKRNYKLRIDMEDFEGRKRYAEYARFSINSSDDNYRLTVSGYSGNAGDSLTQHNGSKFSTIDKNDESGCARTYRGGWWYADCYYCYLNGIYLRGNYAGSASSPYGITWHSWLGVWYSLKSTEMKLIPVA